MKQFTIERSLAFKNPELAKEWDYEANYPLRPESVFPHGRKKVNWICKKCGQSYCSAIDNRSNGHGCPYCCIPPRKICRNNCLEFVSPPIAKEWHYERNKGLTPRDVFCRSEKSVWWICDKGHEYRGKISSRQFCGCPYCSGHKVSRDNCLSAVDSILTKEWHPTKNKNLSPNEVTRFSGKRVWWLCRRCGKEYQLKISYRSLGSGCPRCNGIELKNGDICDSLVEAYYYLLLENKRVKFDHHVSIGLGRCVCDFYVPAEDKYIEVTGYPKKWKHWKTYHKNILRKKKHIVEIIGAKFEFVQMKLSQEQIRYVRDNSV